MTRQELIDIAVATLSADGVAGRYADWSGDGNSRPAELVIDTLLTSGALAVSDWDPATSSVVRHSCGRLVITSRFDDDTHVGEDCGTR